MNKKLLTAVVGAALVAGPMIASAAGPTVYGNLHLSVDYIDSSAGAVAATAPATEQGFISSNNSDFGIKGDDDLGGGLKSLYQVQAGGFAADTGASGFGGTLQDTFVGLSGGFGTVKIGKLDTPMKGLRGIVDGYGTRVGDARNVIGGTGVAGTGVNNNASMMSFDARISNSVRYDSPNLGGAVVTAHWGTSEGSAFSSTNADVISVGATWSAGPAKLGLGYETHSTQIGTGTLSADEEKSIRLVGSFAFGPATVGALYEKMSDLNGVSGKDKDVMGLTGAFKFGNSTVRAQYFIADATDDATTDNGAALMAVGFDHALSKSTTLYAVYAAVDNDDAAAYKVSGAGAHGDSLAANTGAKQTGISGGLQVKF